MRKITKSLMLILLIMLFYHIPLHADEEDDKIKDIILNIKDVKEMIGANPGEKVEYKLIEKTRDNEGDYIAVAEFEDQRTMIIAIIRDLKKAVYWDMDQYIGNVQKLYDIANCNCLFYKASYSHQFSMWRDVIVGLWPPRELLKFEFNSIDIPGHEFDEEEIRIFDIDGDKQREILLHHRLLENGKDEQRTPILLKDEYRPFKYDKKMGFQELKDTQSIKAAKSFFSDKVYSGYANVKVKNNSGQKVTELSISYNKEFFHAQTRYMASSLEPGESVEAQVYGMDLPYIEIEGKIGKDITFSRYFAYLLTDNTRIGGEFMINPDSSFTIQ